MIKIIPNVNRAEPEFDRQFELTQTDLDDFCNDRKSLNALLNIIDFNDVVEKENMVKYFFRKCENPKVPKILWYPSAENDLSDIAELSKFESVFYHGIDHPEIFIHTSMDSFFFNELLEYDGEKFEIKCKKKPLKKAYEPNTRKYDIDILGYIVHSLKNLELPVKAPLNDQDEAMVFIFDIVLSSDRHNPLSQLKLFYFVCNEFDFMINVILNKGLNLTHLIRPDAGNLIGGWSYTHNKIF